MYEKRTMRPVEAILRRGGGIKEKYEGCGSN
jgi:hypothetical protein